MLILSGKRGDAVIMEVSIEAMRLAIAENRTIKIKHVIVQVRGDSVRSGYHADESVSINREAVLKRMALD